MTNILIISKILIYYKNQTYINIVNKTIKNEMYQPYYFSDHKNKPFEKQYDYIKRYYPQYWNQLSDKIMTHLILKEHNRIRGLYLD